MLHNKFWQGFFAIAPIVMGILFFIGYFIFLFFMISEIPTIENTSNDLPVGLFTGIGLILVFALLMVLIGLGSLIFYIVHAAQNPNLKGDNMLVVWILIFLFVGGLGQPIYWIVEIIGKRTTQEIEA